MDSNILMLQGNFHSKYAIYHHLIEVRFLLSVIKSRMCYFFEGPHGFLTVF